MLRITAAAEQSLVLEGRLVGEWVTELQRMLRQRPYLQLDLSQVRFVDAAGVALLRRLQSEGVVLSSPSPFVAELLNSRPT